MSTASTLRSSVAGWLLRLFDGEEPTTHVARFVSWVRCGERTDYAWVELEPPLARLDERGGAVGLAVLAPRHEGVRLDEQVTSSPIHVMILAAPDELARNDVVPPDSLSIAAWATIENRLT